MAQKYPNQVVKEIVEVETVETMKRKITLQHNDCGHTYVIDIYELIEDKRHCGKCKGKVLSEQNAEDIETK